ncbi:carboxypeptidase regulatory-like domain-containing protein [Myxococcus landrumensis]|uniref:Carboxypeptidase regulatory-like domain-containing protein n=1 Tax=Myxococcus landrumensis TaxID=2813577 RepID=A0ABX7NAY7_9BACT|nr:carboxypeptidase regulatory-like domain-containing protein [Myxococcus landrumus]QSQ15828.1 carboxypeptidase regulatory-like domain-containing protein [Myxococcus landrumus]
MSPSSRPLVLPVFVCALVGTLAGCAPGGEDLSIPGPKPPSVTCAVDQDCPDPALFFCNTAISLCEPSCRTRRDCDASRRGEAFAIPACATELGCQCDMNRCEVNLCASNADCVGLKVCRDGACVEPPPSTLAASCQITPDVVVGRPGGTVAFNVWVWDASGRPLVPLNDVVWKALDPDVVKRRGMERGSRATFELVAQTEARALVAASIGSASCTARVTVLSPDVPARGVRVSVVDELTGRPLPKVTLSVSGSRGQGLTSAVTGTDGTAWVPASGSVGVSAFHPDYGYLTLARLDADSLRDLRLSLRRNPLDTSGGVQVAFVEALAANPRTINLRLGMTGLSVPGLVSELTPESLLGAERRVDVGAAGSGDMSLPSGAVVWLEGSAAPRASASGVAGVCDASLAGVLDPEAEILAGTCSTRTAWGLTGTLPMTALPLSAAEPGVDPLLMLGRMLPVSTRFYSSAVRDASFRLVPTPGLSDGAPRPDAVTYPQLVSLDFEGVRLAFPFAVRVPQLPRYRGVYLDRAFVLSTVVAPGRGLVPLGYGAAANVSPADPNADADARLGQPGVVAVRMAPAHHGLEGQPYRLLVGATSRAARDDASAGTPTSFVVTDLSAPPFDPLGERPIAPGARFLPIPEGARYNFDTEASQELKGRELRVVEVGSATLVRVVFTNRLGRRWTVLASPSDAEDGVLIPMPPSGFEDRTYFGDHLGSRSLLRVETLLVSDGDWNDLGPSELVSAEGQGLEKVADLTRAVSALEMGRPEVAWIYPELEGQRLSRGSAVRVRVTGFRPGVDAEAQGRVRVTLKGGKGCDDIVVSDTAVSLSSGEVELRLPSNCSGTGVSLIAALEDTQGALLRPPVMVIRGVDIP